MKRLTATEKWSDPWFRRLTPALKHLWSYLLDHCDNAGVWEPDLELASYLIGMKLPNEADILVEFGGRVQRIKGKWYIPAFVPFQYGNLKDNNPFHKKTLTLLGKHGLEAGRPLEADTEAPIEGTREPLPSHPQAPSQGAQEKEEEKEKSKEEEKKQDPLDIPPPLNTSQPFVNAWHRWMTFRRGMGSKPGNWASLFGEQLTWLATFTPTQATRIVEQSIRNGWKGLFEKGTEDANSTTGKPNPRNAGIAADPGYSDRLAAKVKSMQADSPPVPNVMAAQVADARHNSPSSSAHG